MHIREQDHGKKKAVVTFGRFQPPTLGHRVVLDTMTRLGRTITDAETAAVSLFVIPSPTQDAKKNPLTPVQREEILSEVLDANFHVGIEGAQPRTILEVAHLLDEKGYDELYVVAGSDRVSEFQDLLDRYNGQETKGGHILYEFDAIQVVQAGEARRGEGTLDPDADVTAVSGSAAREAAAANDFDTFQQIFIDPDNTTLARQVFKDLQDAMGVDVPEEDDDEGLPEGEVVEEHRRATNETLRSYLLAPSTSRLIETSCPDPDNPSDEEEKDLDKPPMTKTFVRHGMVEATIEETSEEATLANISFSVKKLWEMYGSTDGNVRDMQDSALIHLSEQLAVVFSYLVEEYGSRGNNVRVALKPIPKKLVEAQYRGKYNQWLQGVLTRRGESIGLGIRFMPEKYSKYLYVDTANG